MVVKAQPAQMVVKVLKGLRVFREQPAHKVLLAHRERLAHKVRKVFRERRESKARKVLLAHKEAQVRKERLARKETKDRKEVKARKEQAEPTTLSGLTKQPALKASPTQRQKLLFQSLLLAGSLTTSSPSAESRLV